MRNSVPKKNRMASLMSAPGDQAGFGMIEVLAAVLVLAVGVLGFVGLQVRAVQASGDAYYRTQAMAIAQDMAERVHINSSQMPTYLTAAQWSAAVTSPPQVCMTGTCLPAAMATFDIQSVIYNAQTMLPQGLVNMQACQGVTNGLNCVYVAWDGVQPTAGTTGQCVDSNGVYRAPPSSKPAPAISCVMLEVL